MLLRKKFFTGILNGIVLTQTKFGRIDIIMIFCLSIDKHDILST